MFLGSAFSIPPLLVDELFKRNGHAGVPIQRASDFRECFKFLPPSSHRGAIYS
jgi:hypothetical protein